VGGLLEARKIHDVCLQHDVPVWCGGMHEYGIGRAHNVALCSLPNFSMPGDVSGSDKYFEEDLTQPKVLAPNGRITVPTDNPGIGYEVNEDTLKRHLVASYNFT
jgi:O-succinylbenzoate synthase